MTTRRGALALATLGLPALAGCAPPAGRSGGAASGRWRALRGLLVPRDSFGLVALGGALYAVGGMAGARGTALASVEAYDPAANAWTPRAPLPLALSSVGAASLAGRLVVAGGAHDDEAVPLAWRFEPPAGPWQAIAPMPSARFGHGLATLDGHLYAAGGLAGGAPVAALERYDPARDAWAALAPLPVARFNLALVAFGGLLYAIGGSGADRRPVATVDRYDPQRDRWSAGPALPEPLSNFAAAALGSRMIHVLHHRTHLVLDRQRGAWLAARPMPTSRHGLGAAVLGSTLYAAGGCAEDPQRDLGTLEALDLVG